MRVGHARNGGDPALQVFGDAQILGAVVADRAHVDLRRDAEIENLRHHVGRLEVEDTLREGRRKHLAQLADIVDCRWVIFLERDQYDAVVEAGRGAVAERVVVGTLRQADIVDDRLAFVLGDDLADLVFHSLENLLGLFDARARRRAHVQLDLAAVDDREEVAADD